MRTRLRGAWQELRLFLGYALVVFRPGALPPQHPHTPPAVTDLPADWDGAACQLFVGEARRDMDQQQADKRDVRSRGQQVFTTTLVLGAAIGASYTSRHPHGGALALYVAAAVLTALGGLASAGIVTAKSVVGAPNLDNLTLMPSAEVERRLALEYAATRHVGAATIAVLVTVLRDAVLALVVAFAFFACGHIWA
jgi:hypothetical protein